MTTHGEHAIPSRQIRLPDGRLLGYSEYGEPEGRPVFFFHGWPGARLQGKVAHTPAQRFGVRIIATDRPGFGLSDFQPGRTLSDWPDDVVRLADDLEIARFAVLGVSGGGPYALACAHRIPQRLTAVTVVSGVGSTDVPGALDEVSRTHRLLIRLARTAPWLLRLLLWRTVRRRRRDPEGAFAQIIAAAPEPDRATLSRPEIKQLLMEAGSDSFRPGIRGHAWEMRLFGRPWGFRLEEITVPVYLWHGEEDRDVLAAMGRRQAAALPDCHATFYPGEGHFSTFVNHLEEILKVV